ncbi:MAG: hypothetical protein ACKV19_19875 [Verrucomicrobiales bacterium]
MNRLISPDCRFATPTLAAIDSPLSVLWPESNVLIAVWQFVLAEALGRYHRS